MPSASSVTFSRFASGVTTESAFDVLAVAKKLISQGKDVFELEIGDSPFPSSPSAIPAAKAAMDAGECRYAPSAGLPELRAAAAKYMADEYGVQVTAENVVVGPGAKNFEQLFMECFVDPGDGVLVFTPHFPTYPPNIARRGARMVTAVLSEENQFRPQMRDVKRFLASDPSPKAIVLNTPNNPTGGVATRDDLVALAELVRGRDIAIFSDEPYDRMVWTGKHETPIALPGMLDQCVSAYTMSKSYSMSGWRLGFAVSSQRNIQMLGKLTNTSISCVSPFTQRAGIAVLEHDHDSRENRMRQFHDRLVKLVEQLNAIDGVRCLMPAGAFYAFANVSEICRVNKIRSQGLAMYLLEEADPKTGVACLGGECFGEAGQGFLRLSVAEPPDRLESAAKFMQQAFAHGDRIAGYLAKNPQYRL
ncbi:pyridoxal phosphate-dependent aminotransferase [Stieleria varia]|uniref:Aspartate aminotransferase n=1 Tax=Stieleria varia TaxID=2528005 RepID=A0A5C6B8U7_9BACT|nr:aminotransferase class I/II-fold pyridoxal phosphate-dependent enzyme [Stieleria varia]TWU07729.1 Aspartate aminotransferase [Stieleria varia]